MKINDNKTKLSSKSVNVPSQAVVKPKILLSQKAIDEAEEANKNMFLEGLGHIPAYKQEKLGTQVDKVIDLYKTSLTQTFGLGNPVAIVMPLFSDVTLPTEAPHQTAQKIMQERGIKTASNSPEAIIGMLKQVNTETADVLKQYKAGKVDIDGLYRDCLHKISKVARDFYKESTLNNFMPMTQKEGHEVAQLISKLNGTSIEAEEIIEKNASEIIFKAIANNPDTYKQRIEELALKKLADKGVDNPTDQQLRWAKTEVLTVDYPKEVQEANPEAYKGLSALPYYHNYTSLINSEMPLFTTPLIAQKAEQGYKDIENFVGANPMIHHAILSIIDHHKDNPAKAKEEIIQWVEKHPELHGVKSLEDKTITFLGAGLPLSGILLHVMTDAKVNLLDYSKSIPDMEKQFVKITDSLGITKPDAIKVIHGNAMDVELRLPSDDLSNPVAMGKTLIKTDIGQLASSLPGFVNDEALNNGSKHMPLMSIRAVEDMAVVRYQPYKPQENNSQFTEIGHVCPPQRYMGHEEKAPQLTRFMTPYNVSSHTLYANLKAIKNQGKDIDRRLIDANAKKYYALGQEKQIKARL